jgi:hypothetical protein
VRILDDFWDSCGLVRRAESRGFAMIRIPEDCEDS